MAALFVSCGEEERISVLLDPECRLLRLDLPPAEKNQGALSLSRSLPNRFLHWRHASPPVPFQAGLYEILAASVDIELKPTERIISGKAAFRIKTLSALDRMRFALSAATASARCSPTPCGATSEGDRLELAFAAAPGVGAEVDISVEWRDAAVERVVDFTPEGGGMVLANLIGEESTFFTFGYHFWPAPQQAEGGVEATFTFTHPTPQRLLFSGDLLGEQREGEKTESRWRLDWRPGRGVALSLGKYIMAESSCLDGRIEIYALPGKSSDGFPIKPDTYAPLIKEICEYFGRWFGESPSPTTPFPVIRLAGVDERFTNGYSTPGLILAPNYTFDDDGSGSFPERNFFLAHELSHQWWGNRLGISSISDLWLIEGMADYLALAALESLEPGSFPYLWLWEAKPLLDFYRAGGSEHPLVFPAGADIEYRIPYIKGAWVLRMLRDVAPLDSRLADIYRQNRDGRIDSQYFAAQIQNASAAELGWFFEQWLYGIGLVELESNFKEQGDKMELVVRQKRPWSREPLRFFRAPLTVQIRRGKLFADRQVELDGVRNENAFVLELP